MNSQPLLIVFLGFPGSGKTYFATRLANSIQAVTLNSDALRLSMFGSHEAIERIRNTQRGRLYQDVFGAMDYAARQVLRSGVSVIYDAQASKRADRQSLEKLAHEVGGLPAIVWLKTSPETALQRGQKREARADSHQYSASKMKMLIERFDRVTDLPEPSENVIEISGEVDFEKQYATFLHQLETIRQRSTG